MYIYVQDKDGRPLMPTMRCGKVRRMLRDGRAVIKGFRLFDIVALDGTRAYVHGRRATGRFVVKDLDGRTLSNSVNCKKLRLISHSNRYLFNTKKRNSPIPPPSEDGSILGIFS